jgi:hypothetical protein
MTSMTYGTRACKDHSAHCKQSSIKNLIILLRLVKTVNGLYHEIFCFWFLSGQEKNARLPLISQSQTFLKVVSNLRKYSNCGIGR